jgi:hypothetical protein
MTFISLIKFKPCPSGPIFHDESLEKDFCATDPPDTSTLDDEKKNSTNEHENFSFKFPQDSCSYKESPESILHSTTCSHQDHNLLLTLSSKMFRRTVVDALIYH